MKNLKRIFICFICVLVFNSMVLFMYSFLTEKENDDVIESGTFFDVLINDNSLTEPSDYEVSNWDSETSLEEKEAIISIIEKADCQKTNRFVACSVQLFQNSRNSISEIELVEFDGVKKVYANNTVDWFSKTYNSAISCEVVKLFKDYYLICDYINDVDDLDNFFSTSVYKIVNSDDVCEIDDYKKSNEYYSRTYPDKISFFESSPLWIVLFIVFLLLEVFLLNKISVKIGSRNKKHKTVK